MIRKTTGGITAARGFRAASCAAGIKYKNRTDMAMIVSDRPCVTAGAFTRNLIKAAPVLWDQAVIEQSPYTRAIVVNAGIANACTGQEGMDYCAQTARAAAKELSVPEGSVLVASTGVIGMPLPIDRITNGIKTMQPFLAPTLTAGHDAAMAIMTTDTRPKEAAAHFQAGGKTVTIGGMCKGSGMIHPDMCTMLSFITTDAVISRELLQKALLTDLDDTYHMISVDGDTSTNDTVLVLANGASETTEIHYGTKEYKDFVDALHYVNEELSKMIAGDGEGATALFEVKVQGAKDKLQAKTIAKSVVCSSLTKAAIFGHDANWGRILCAMGYSGAEFDPSVIHLHFKSRAGRIQIIKEGAVLDYSEVRATEILSEPEVTVLIDLQSGKAEATAWGCDLTYDYVKINADYRS